VGILKATSAPASYKTPIGGKTPEYRIELTTLKEQSGKENVLVGDLISYSYYLYHIYYLDATYAYIDNRQVIRGSTGAKGTDGTDGVTPHIGENDNWWIGDVDTLVPARGTDGKDGTDGKTPYIENGYWYINGHSTGVRAEGRDGADSVSEHALPYGGSKEWLEANGDKTQLYQIDGYVWGYIEADGWVKSGTQFRVVQNESQMTDTGGTPYLLRNGATGTVYSYTEASGDTDVTIVDTIPDTAEEGDVIVIRPTEVNSFDKMTDISKLYALDGKIYKGKEVPAAVNIVSIFFPYSSVAVINCSPAVVIAS
jgi:hypothetical protein